MGCVAVTKTEHLLFTNQWRSLIPYGTIPNKETIWEAAKQIYADYPALLETARATLGL